MALTARFQADFSSFYEAVQKAAVSLKSFEGDANKVGSSLNRMADSLSGRKLIQDATLMAAAVEKIGGPARLTANELQRVSAQATEAVAKMKALGVEVPPKIQALANHVKPLPGAFSQISSAVMAVGGALGLAFTGFAIINGIKNQIKAALEYGDTLALLKAKTELSYRDLQILEDVGISTGVSIQSLANAVQILQQRLGDGTARKGIQALGLSFDAILRMSPAEQFAAIGAAIARIEDPTKRATAANAVFGRAWKEITPALRANMEEISKAVVAMGDKQIDVIDRTGDRWDQFVKNNERRTASWLSGFLLAIDDMGKAWTEMEQRMGQGGTPKLPGAPKARIGSGPWEFAAPDPTTISQLKIYGLTLDETVKATEKATLATKKSADAREKFLEMSKQARGSEFEWQNQILLTKFKTDQLVVSETQLFEVVSDLSSFIASHKGEMFPEPPPGSLDAWKKGQKIIKELPPDVSTLGDRLSDLAESFAQLGQISGGSLGNVARAIGTVVTAMNVAKEAGKGFNEGLKKGGAEGYSQMAVSAMAAVAAIDAATSSTSKYKNVLGGAAAGAAAGSKIFPVLGTAIGAAAGALVGWWKSNNMEGKTVSPLRDEFFKMAGGLEKLNPEVQKLTGNLTLVQAVFDARTVEQYNAALKELQDLFAFQAQAMVTLEETARKYNLTIEEMGPAWQRQEMDKKAQELFKDYQVLTSAGIDHILILGKMGTAVNAYVQNALKMGVEVPSAMRPMLQQMVDAGLLLDAQGKKFGTLEEAGISFALTMSEGFTMLIDEVKKLTDAIARGLGLAIKNIPDAEVEIRGKFIPPKDMGQDLPVFEMAKGGAGMVKKPTLFLAGEEGPEEFAFSGSGKKFAGASAAGSASHSGGSVTFNLMVPNGKVLSELVVQDMPGVLRELGLA